MFKRAWVAGILLGLSFSLAGPVIAQSPEQPEENQTENDGQNQSGFSGNTVFGFTVRLFEEPEESESSKRQQKEAAEREENDLIAQKSMADSTKEIVWLTKIQLALALAGTFALLWTLYLNRRATDAAVNAVKVTREIGEKQVRAYIGRETDILKNSVDHGSNKPIGIQVGVSLKNYGNSPAEITEFFVDVVTFPSFAAMREVVFQVPDGVREKQPLHLGPNSTQRIDARIVSIDEIGLCQSGKRRCFLATKVIYRDVFWPKTNEHTFTCCSEIKFLLPVRDYAKSANNFPNNGVISESWGMFSFVKPPPTEGNS